MDTYDAGLLNDYGGGDVGWWQDYLRAELGRAEEFYRNQHDRIVADRDAEIERMRHDRDNWRGLAKIALAQFDALSEMAPPPQKGLLLRRIKELAEIRALKESPDA